MSEKQTSVIAVVEKETVNSIKPIKTGKFDLKSISKPKPTAVAKPIVQNATEVENKVFVAPSIQKLDTETSQKVVSVPEEKIEAIEENLVEEQQVQEIEKEVEIVHHPKPKTYRFRIYTVVACFVGIMSMLGLFSIHNAVVIDKATAQYEQSQKEVNVNINKIRKNLERLDDLRDNT